MRLHFLVAAIAAGSLSSIASAQSLPSKQAPTKTLPAPSTTSARLQGSHTSLLVGGSDNCANAAANDAISGLGTKTNSGGASQYPVAGDQSVSVRGLDSAGDVRTYQCWYRNSDPTFCTSATFNLTNGAQVTWTP